MDTDTRFEIGDQTLWNDLYYGNLAANRRRNFSFNRIRRVVNMISGHQRRNRKSTICVPVENGDSETADQLSKTLMWISNQEGVLETISDSFHGALVTGMNLLQVWVDYRSDPISGNIRVDNCSYNSFLIDPYFRKQDLSDCNYIWKRSFLTKRECISLMPDHMEEISGLVANDYGGSRDSKFQYLPESYNYAYNNLLTYDEYYYRDYREQKLLVDTQTGETLEWRNQDDERLKLFLQTYPQVTVIKQTIPTVKLAVVIQGKVFYDDANPIGIDQYPFVPVLAYYNPQSPYFPWRIQGVVRGLRDSQYLYNRRKIIELDILESQINSGFIYKENALVNPKDVFTQIGQGKGIALKDEALMTDVQQIQAPQIPPSMIELSKILAQEIQEISGINEELLGSATDDKAGILSMLRQGAGLTTLQVLFDNLDHAQKLLGRLMLDIIQTNFAPGKIKKILEGQEPTAQFYNKAFGKYNCVVEEGLNTSTQKQMNFAQLLQLREVGVPIPDDILLEAATIQDKKKLIETIQANMQAQQQQQEAQSEAAMQLQQAQIRVAESTAKANDGLGLERISRIEENQALAEERKAAAIKDDYQAILNFVKAAKELGHMDIQEIKELIAIKNMVDSQEQAKMEKEQPSEVRGQPLAAPQA